MTTVLAETPLGLHAPATATAGEAIALSSAGSGPATFYLIGPGHTIKRQVQAGENIQISSVDLSSAGTYEAMICNQAGCADTKFYATADGGAELIFLVHPSRVQVGQSNAISAVAVVVDRFQNLVTQPEAVVFLATTNETTVSSPPLSTRNGIAWTRLSSGLKTGAVEISASLGQRSEPSERRVVQQVATEACNLRASAERDGDRIVLQTDPVRDCRGNSVPDGTIVTFTKLDKLGRSTVDAPIKKGVARTEMALDGPATISVACGVVVGNDIHAGGAR